MAKHIVKSPIRHGGARHEIGAEVDLPEDVAAALAALGRVAPSEAVQGGAKAKGGAKKAAGDGQAEG